MAFYKDKFPTSKVPLVSFGYSLGGATAVALERVYGTDAKVFDAHVLTVPNMGLDTAMQLPEETLKAFYLLPADKELFPFTQNPDEFLKEYYADPLQYTG